MTARPPEPLHDDPLSAEERDLAARLARLDASVGPSAALDARILASAHAASAPRVRPRRRRWTQGVGAAAVLAVAVGLAWQLKPMFALPPPLHSEHSGRGAAGVESDVVVQVESVPRRAPPPSPPADAAADVAQAAAPAAARQASPSPGGRTAEPRAKVAAARAAPALPQAHDLSDEAVPLSGGVLDSVAAAPAPAPASTANVAAPVAADAPPPMARKAMTEAAGVSSPPDVRADAKLPLTKWIARIRERRDAGDIAGARASLARFVVAHPKARLPADLRALRDDTDPWSP